MHDAALIDHDEAPAEPLDVGEVVGRQHDRRIAGGAQRGEERAYGLLAHQVESDRRLVEEQYLGPVEKCRRELAPHPLAERELADWDVEEGVEIEKLPAVGQPAGVLRGRHRVDVTQQRERVPQWQVPPER